MSCDQFKDINDHFNKPDEREQKIAELENQLKFIRDICDAHAVTGKEREEEITQLKAKLLEAENKLAMKESEK